jgi:hypothetical protein
MDVRKVKVSMGMLSSTPSPLPAEEPVENDDNASSIIEEEIVVKELMSDTESGSNYSNNA